MAKKKSSGFGRVFLGFVLGIVAVAAVVFLQVRYQVLPRSLVDKAFPREGAVAKPSAEGRTSREKKESPLNLERPGRASLSPEKAPEKKQPPFGISEDVFEGGAKVYRARCASCHGTPGHDGSAAHTLKPAPLQLWKKQAGGVVGVSDKDVAETYRQVANGIRPGMPAYSKVLSDTQMWQVSLLLKNAKMELPMPVAQLLSGKSATAP
jgi:thiosulfate dehydrogenase